MGFLRDCFTGEDSNAARRPTVYRDDDGLMVIGTVVVVGGITFIMTVIHPALGAGVLIAGVVLGALLSRIK